MAASQRGGQAAAAPRVTVGFEDAAQEDAFDATQSLANMKACTTCDLPTEDNDYTMDGENDAQHPPENDGKIPSPENASTVMGPPAAPASLFWTFEKSPRAKSDEEKIDDLYIVCRLAAVVVILFRAGNIRYAKVIGQFAVDIMGRDKWHETLPPYLSSKPDPSDYGQVHSLVNEAQKALKMFDLQNAAYLEGVLATMG